MIDSPPVPLAFQQLGEGDPLVILHGLLGSGTNWRSIARSLSDCRSIYLLDARNHGASPHHDAVHYRAMANDVLAFLDTHDLDSADVVGHSMGGKIAMQLALVHPQRVRQLMVVDIAPAVSTSDSAALIELMQRLPLAEMQRRSDLDRALAEHVSEPGVRAFIAQNAVSRDGGLAWRVNLPAIARGMRDLLDFPMPDAAAAYPGPTMFVGGEHSDYLSSEHHDVIHTLFSDCRIETVRDAGHWVHAEQPSAFTALLREFLRCV